MQQRRRLVPTPTRPVTAIVSAVALLASAVVGIGANQILHTDNTGIDPIEASVSTDSLASGQSITIDDAAISAQGKMGSRTVKQFHRDQPFSQFAITWNGEKDIAAFVRAQRADGTWSEWYDTEPLDYGAGDTEKRGTDVIYIEPTNTIQVSMSGVDITGGAPATPPNAEAAPQPAAGQPAADASPAAPAEDPAVHGMAPLPSNFGDIKPVAEATNITATNNVSDFDVVFIEGGESQLPENGIQMTADSDGMPRVISRKGWGANESIRCQQPSYFDGVKGITIHHTAGSNNYSEAQAPGIVRGIYQYHAQTLGWCDVGYQSLADKYGNLYEGRYGGLNRNVWGAHAGGFNENTWAISMLGNYDTAPTTPAMIKSVGELAGWRSAVAGIDPTGSGTHYSEGTSYTPYPKGQAVNLPNIFAHRDVGNTACPGKHAYAQMGNIRTTAKQKYNSIKNGTAPSGGIQNTPPRGDAPAPQHPAPAPAQPNAQIANIAELITKFAETPMPKDLNSAVAAGGSLLLLAAAIASTQGLIPGNLGAIGNVQVINGLKLSQIPPIITRMVDLISNPNITRAWNDVKTIFGPVLGNPRSGVAPYASKTGEEVEYALFDHGIIVSTPSTGANALWGAIGDAWAQQGFDAGPLGLPTGTQYRSGEEYRVDFQHGYITFNPATGAIDIHTN
ncbi:N-acetylmuramoyl-L-alanine amidase [Corynebacterium pseudotuberculosis]|uniref:N-acetylmuramoyl-L-alanine amidase n=1 Tax=Corynebacterium pseudotuberculosis TaxID=1719 RepID=UPI0008F4DF69|nr:N-acetylmuramoyl-L-alanine amidase [Corynebacterium pseudotuberculosis]APA72382.1 Peptidoglycan recognition protein [Corynebacterium pseudotuberculosis]